LGCELLVQAPAIRAHDLIRCDIVIRAATQRHPENLPLLEKFHFGTVCKDCGIATTIRTARLTFSYDLAPRWKSPYLKKDGWAYSVYFATLQTGHDDIEASLTVSIGKWWDDCDLLWPTEVGCI
jgi:hypothetical protein